jgi:8-oxo-dGTP pyrophosphatase MutT (NUDIX family)
MNKKNIENLKNKLPEYPNVQGRDKYINSAVLVPLVEVDGEYHLLFQRRAKSITQGSDICFPGGVFDSEKDRSFLDTALREVYEELGIEKHQIRILGRLDTVVAPMGVTIDSFPAVLDSTAVGEMKINPQEVEEVFTVPVRCFKQNPASRYYIRLEVQPSFLDKHGEEVILFPAKDLGLPERYHKPWGYRKYSVWAYSTEHGVVWGVTAEIIHEIVSRCY